jgi:hypothetical protein
MGCSICSSSDTCCSEGLLKFSGIAAIDLGGGNSISYLPDDFGPVANRVDVPIAYPMATRRKLFNLAVNLGALTIPNGATVLVELQKDGVDVAGFSVTYTVADTGGGIKVNTATPVISMPVGATFTLKVVTAGFGETAPLTVPLTVTIGMSS